MQFNSACLGLRNSESNSTQQPPATDPATQPEGAARPTLTDVALVSNTDAEIEELLSAKPQVPESSYRKTARVESLYSKFCRRTKHPVEGAPDLVHLCAFMRFLAIYARHALSGIDASLKPYEDYQT